MFSRLFERGATALFAALAFAFAFWLLPPAAHAQQTGTIAGTVTDAGTLEPVVGAQVFLPGTDIGTLTGGDGTYRLTGVPAGTHQLRVQVIGYQPGSRDVQLQAGETTTEDFALQVSAVALDEVVATVSGVQRRREAGHSIARISAAEEVERAAPANVSNLIQGRAAGVQVQQASGTVGGASTIKVRGNTSISLDNTPLVFIDGARISNDITTGPGVGGQTASRLNDLNPDDIESIEVIKGPAASALYGSEAAAGVVVIHTKRGQPDVNQWAFRAEMGGNWDATDWPDNVFHPVSLLGETAADTLYRMNLLEGRGWPDTPWRTGFEQKYAASLRGGIENVNYYLSGEWADQEGNLPNNEFQRLNVRGNFSIAPSERVDISASTGFTSNQLMLPDNDNNAFGYIGVAMLGFPWEMPMEVDGVETCPLDVEFSRMTGAPLGSLGCAANPFFATRTFSDVATLDNEQDIERFTGSATVDFRAADWLTIRGVAGYDQFSDQTGSFVPVNPDRPFDDLSLGFRQIDNFVHRNLTLTGSADAVFALTPDLVSTTTLGTQFGRELIEHAGSLGRFLPAGTRVVDNAVRTEGFESIVETRTIGLFAQQQFGFRDRLFVTPAIRLDDNSAFGEQLGMEAYPRLSASYVLSEEDWFPDGVRSFRVRGSWGMSGKQPASFAALQLLESQRVTFRGADVAGISLTRPGNPELQPERGTEIELGFEAEVLDGRLGLDFTWFNQNTEDAIVARQMAPSTGFLNPIWTNVGEIRNRGVELGVDAVALDNPDVRWDWRVNVATNHNEILQLEEPIIFGLGGDSQRHQEGFPFAAYFTPEVSIGPDGEVQISDDAVFHGHPTPEWEGSVSTTVALFDVVTLYGNLGFAGGHQQFNSTEEFLCGFLGGGPFGGICPTMYETGPDGEFTDEARVKQEASAIISYSPWIEDADFARLRTVSARFDLPESWTQTLRASRASFTVIAENLALWTGYTGLDPEINYAGGTQTTRADFLTLPPSRRLIGQFSITF